MTTTPTATASQLSAVAGEFDRIARYFRPLTSKNPGAFDLTDDAGILTPNPGFDLVVTTDAMVAGIHFLADDSPDDVAWKLLAVNLSDLAAKGASPLVYSLVTALPRQLPESWLAAFAKGLADGQSRWGIALLGGDSVSTDGPICVTISAIGQVPTGQMVKRRGAQIGDLVCVTGTIGDGALGLQVALGKADSSLRDDDRAYLIGRLRRPSPRLSIADALRRWATAALDISDGLAADLGHLARASSVGLRVTLDSIPLSPPVQVAMTQRPELLATILAGGDDYEVAFTIPPAHWAEMLAAAAAVGLPVSRIGIVTQEADIVRFVASDGSDFPLDRKGWTHF